MIVLLPAGLPDSGCLVPLDADESHHLRVRRAEPGETVQIRNGSGLLGTAVLVRTGSEYGARVSDRRLADPPVPLALAVGAGDKERFGWLVEKAGELGVTDVYLIETEHTGRVSSRVRESHLPKLSRRAVEAIKQSGAAWAPRLHAPVKLSAFLSTARAGARWVADGAGTAPVRAAVEPVTVLVGPEAGFSLPEGEAILAAGWTPVRLGSHVLRFETAAIVAAALAGILDDGGR